MNSVLLLFLSILQVPTLLDRACHPLAHFGLQTHKPLDHALPILSAHFLVHLELALQTVDLDLDSDDVLLQNLYIGYGRLRHGPCGWLLPPPPVYPMMEVSACRLRSSTCRCKKVPVSSDLESQ